MVSALEFGRARLEAVVHHHLSHQASDRRDPAGNRGCPSRVVDSTASTSLDFLRAFFPVALGMYGPPDRASSLQPVVEKPAQQSGPQSAGTPAGTSNVSASVQSPRPESPNSLTTDLCPPSPASRQELGERLYPLVAATAPLLEPQAVGKVTGMILEMPKADVVAIVGAGAAAALAAGVEGALGALAADERIQV